VHRGGGLDLPVFIFCNDPLPPRVLYKAGIPVPEGTYLDKASERTAIEDAQWHEQKSKPERS
jgi:hypothetical protein